MARSRDPEATRAAILDAAEQVFLAKGFGNSSVSEIARLAGVTKSLIHHHFRSKESLWHDVKARRFSEYADEQVATIERSEPTAELLEQAVKDYFIFLKKNPQLVRILAWVFLERDKHSTQFDATRITRPGIEAIRRTQDCGELRSDVDARFMLFTFVGLAQHYFQDKCHLLDDYDWGGSEDDLDAAYLEAMVKIFFEGALPR